MCTRKKITGRQCPCKVPRLLLGNSPNQSTMVAPLSTAPSSPASASSSPSPASPEALMPPAPLSLAPAPAPPALALPGGEARVNEDALPEALAALEPKAELSSPGEVIELSNEDEPKDLTPLVIAAPTTPAIPTIPTASVAYDILGPSAPCTAGPPDTSHDEITRKLYIELNREILGIPGDGGLVILISNEEEDIEAEEKVDDEEKDDAVSDSGSSMESEAAPISPLSS